MICLITSPLKSFIAVYEGEDKITYTTATSRSRCTSKSMIASPEVPIFDKIMPYTFTGRID